MVDVASTQLSNGPTLEGRRVELVPFAPADIPFLHSLWTDSAVRRYLWDDRTISRDEAAAVVAGSIESFSRHGFGLWLIRLKPELTPVGFCGLRHLGERLDEVELLYALLPEHWHRGLATEASRAVLQLGFRSGLREVFAGADPPNTASQGVLERLGMVYHGTRLVDGVETIYFAVDQATFAKVTAAGDDEAR